MLSIKYNLCIKSMPGVALLAGAFVIVTACGLIGQTLSPTILEGQQFAHTIQLPSRFRMPDNVNGPFSFDHYGFRVSDSSPDLLVVSACGSAVLSTKKFEASSEVCSPNTFAIDTAHSYVSREARQGEWDQAAPILGEKEMDDPVRRTLKQELAKPAFLRAIPIDPSQGRGGYYEGYAYRGKEYRRRGDWIVSLNFASSEDGKLVVLAGVDKRKLPKSGFLGDPLNGGSSGLITIDVFAADPAHRVAALDLDSHININVARRRVSLVNSRWLAIGLDVAMQKMLLFDFRALGEPK